MLVIETKGYKEMSRIASDIVIDDISKKPDLAIGFATGKTPLRLYKELAKAYRNNRVNFSKVKGFNLDEYYPIKKSDKRSYHHYLFKNLFSRVNIKKPNIFLLNGEAKDPKKECRDYEKKIKKHCLDLVILGIGLNGHIAFNEPGSSLNSKTRIVELTPETIRVNSGFFRKNVPEKAMTVGIKDIMSSKKIILLASGKKKSGAVKRFLEGEVDSSCPASFLTGHKNLAVILDKKARRLLKKD